MCSQAAGPQAARSRPILCSCNVLAFGPADAAWAYKPTTCLTSYDKEANRNAYLTIEGLKYALFG